MGGCMFLSHCDREGFTTVFNEIIEGELSIVERNMRKFKRGLVISSGDKEIDEIKRIVFSAALSHLRSEYDEMRKYGLAIEASGFSKNLESVSFTET
jgi:hypothetical protein